MKKPHSDSPAVAQFKGDVAAVKAYLVSAGYDIQNSHLLEAFSRYEHQRNYHTYRAKLEKGDKPVPKKTVTRAYDLQGKTVTVTFAGHSTTEWDPLAGDIVLVVDQKWINHLLKMNALVKANNIRVTEGENLEFIGFEDTPIHGAEINIYDVDFFLAGDVKHSDFQVQTSLIDIEPFLEKVIAARDKGVLDMR